MTAAQPSRMRFAVAPGESGAVTVRDCPITYATWGPLDGPAIGLVHGAGAHMGWWDAVITELADEYRVVALELSGNGDSGRRGDYNGFVWAEEVLAVMARAAGAAPIVVAGHSLGGRVGILAAARDPDMIRGLVLVDAPLRRPAARARQGFSPRAPGRRHPSLDQAMAAFHLRPAEPVLNHDLLQRVAAAAYRRADGGWVLKSDSGIYGRIDDRELAESLSRITQPITMVYGGRSSSLDEDGRLFLAETHPGSTELVRVDEGFHHLTFDHAPQVAGAIRELASRVLQRPATK